MTPSRWTVAAVAPTRRPIPLVEEVAVIRFKAGERSIEHFPARYDDDIERRVDLVTPEHLARQALGTVPDNGRPDLARRRDPEPAVPCPIANALSTASL